MPTNLNEHLDEARASAREAAFEKQRETVAARVAAERRMTKAGTSDPMTVMLPNLEQVEKLRKNPQEYAQLCENTAFAERVAFLEQEMADGLETIQDAEDSAAELAMASVPPDIALSERHEHERQCLLASAGCTDAESAPAIVQDALRDLIGRQAQELTTKSDDD